MGVERGVQKPVRPFPSSGLAEAEVSGSGAAGNRTEEINWSQTVPGSGLRTSGGMVRAEPCLRGCHRERKEVERKQEGALAGNEFSGLLTGVTDLSHDHTFRKNK